MPAGLTLVKDDGRQKILGYNRQTMTAPAILHALMRDYTITDMAIATATIEDVIRDLYRGLTDSRDGTAVETAP